MRRGLFSLPFLLSFPAFLLTVLLALLSSSATARAEDRNASNEQPRLQAGPSSQRALTLDSHAKRVSWWAGARDEDGVDDDSDMDSDSDSRKRNRHPKARLRIKEMKIDGEGPSRIRLDAGRSKDRDGTIEGYAFSIADARTGEIVYESGSVTGAIHYAAVLPGKYRASVRVTDDRDASDVKRRGFSVKGAIPNAGIHDGIEGEIKQVHALLEALSGDPATPQIWLDYEQESTLPGSPPVHTTGFVLLSPHTSRLVANENTTPSMTVRQLSNGSGMGRLISNETPFRETQATVIDHRSKASLDSVLTALLTLPLEPVSETARHFAILKDKPHLKDDRGTGRSFRLIPVRRQTQRRLLQVRVLVSEEIDALWAIEATFPNAERARWRLAYRETTPTASEPYVVNEYTCRGDITVDFRMAPYTAWAGTENVKPPQDPKLYSEIRWLPGGWSSPIRSHFFSRVWINTNRGLWTYGGRQYVSVPHWTQFAVQVKQDQFGVNPQYCQTSLDENGAWDASSPSLFIANPANGCYQVVQVSCPVLVVYPQYDDYDADGNWIPPFEPWPGDDTAYLDYVASETPRGSWVDSCQSVSLSGFKWDGYPQDYWERIPEFCALCADSTSPTPNVNSCATCQSFALGNQDGQLVCEKGSCCIPNSCNTSANPTIGGISSANCEAGCHDQTCEARVCAANPGCCEFDANGGTNWDLECATAARQLCPELCEERESEYPRPNIRQ